MEEAQRECRKAVTLFEKYRKKSSIGQSISSIFKKLDYNEYTDCEFIDEGYSTF